MLGAKLLEGFASGAVVDLACCFGSGQFCLSCTDAMLARATVVASAAASEPGSSSTAVAGSATASAGAISGEFGLLSSLAAQPPRSRTKAMAEYRRFIP